MFIVIGIYIGVKCVVIMVGVSREGIADRTTELRGEYQAGKAQARPIFCWVTYLG